MFALSEKPIDEMRLLELMTENMDPVETPERYGALRDAKEQLMAKRLELLLAGEDDAITVCDVVLTRVRRALRKYENLPPHQVVNALFDRAVRRG